MKGILATGVLALLLAGCGDSPSGKAASSSAGSSGGSAGGSSSASTDRATTASGGKAIKTITVKETEFELSPSTIELSKPGTYAFEAEDKGNVQHSLEVEGKGVRAEEHEAELDRTLGRGQGGVLRVTFARPGTYEI